MDTKTVQDMYRRIWIITGLLLLVVAAKAQVAFSSVEDVWRYADEHNISLRLAKYDARKAELGRAQSYGALLPQVSAAGSYTDNLSLQTTLLPGVIVGKPLGTYVPVQFGQQFIYAGSVTAQMDVLNLQSWFNVQTARINAEMSKDSLAYTKKNIYQQIATQYYGMLLMSEAERLAQRSAVTADSVFQSVSNKYSTGTVNKASVDVAQINKEKAEQTLITARYQIRTAKNNLKILLDLSLSDSLVINDNLKPGMSADIAGTFTEDPAIKLAYNAMRISMAQYKAYNMLFVPTLSVAYNTAQQLNQNKFEPLDHPNDQWFAARYWSLKLSWNIFSGGSRYYQSRRNKIGVEERKLQYESAMNQSVINDENLRLNYQKSAALLEKARNIMELSFDNYGHISNKYDEGLSSLDDRLYAFTDYINYQNQYLNSLSDMLVQLYLVKLRQLDLR